MLPIDGLVWYYLYVHVQVCTHTLQTWKGTQGGTGHTLCSVEVFKGKPKKKFKKKKNLYIFYLNWAGMENHVHIVLICGLLLRNFNR